MKSISHLRPVRAFILLMLTSAVIHLVTLAIYFVQTHDSIPLNFFSIVGFDLFFPSLVTSPFATIYSLVATISIYSILFFFFTHENRRSR
jgi:uncharacterized membrane protein